VVRRLSTRINNYLLRVTRAIVRQSISFISLLVSLTLLVINTVKPTTVPTTVFSTTGAVLGGGVSLGVVGVTLLLLTILFGVIRVAKE
jgi:formate-dependent nitrite reductase membrane component NrfD